RDNGWKRNKREEAVNPDLWERLLNLGDQHQVEFRWLRGHSGSVENERCDQLAVNAARQPDLPEDIEYKNSA
ncbi:MAG TPA: RNase H family protein, partial [Dehalococcoidia bacterium]|nr:RNase H family protein [Dehalococcoidia bacterium]